MTTRAWVVPALLLAGCASGPTVINQTPSSTVTVTVTTPPAGTSGVRGTVTAGPTCPVEQVGHPCPPHPVQVDLVLVGPTGSVVAKGRSAADGTFSMAAPTGDGTLQTAGQPSALPRCPAQAVTIRSGQYTTVQINCDTGIR